jgi:hypothetical protein
MIGNTSVFSIMRKITKMTYTFLHFKVKCIRATCTKTEKNWEIFNMNYITDVYKIYRSLRIALSIRIGDGQVGSKNN